MKLKDIKRVRMLGAGGIGMSAIARFLRMEGKEVSGYDKTPTPLTAALESEGVAMDFEPRPEALEGVDVVIYTPAVPKSHPEFAGIERLGIPLMKRAEFLGMLSLDHRTVAVAGTHGKTSTSGLTTHLLRAGGVDTAGFVGGIARNFGSNFVWGRSGWMVAEADEFDRSFLHLRPELAVITSMDADHLDIYGKADFLKEAFREFAARIQPGGTLFLNVKLDGIPEREGLRILRYGLNDGDCRAENVRHEGLGSSFDYRSPLGEIEGLRINLPGDYNVENATAAISVALAAGAEPEGIREGLASFLGIQRRFDIRHREEGLVYIDDYAHHPEEINALMTAVRQMLPDHKVIAAFQPHLYSRTRDFYEGFAQSLSRADEVFVVPIYPAREQPMEGVSSELIYERLTCAFRGRATLKEVPDALASRLERPCVVLTVGAGDIDTQVEPVRNKVIAWAGTKEETAERR